MTQSQHHSSRSSSSSSSGSAVFLQPHSVELLHTSSYHLFPTMASVITANNSSVCSRCVRIQGLTMPGDSVPMVRFCLAEWPDCLCMHCCRCSVCVDRCMADNLIQRILTPVHLYLNLPDAHFDTYCKAQDDM